jgi:hypothetical protein
MATKLYSPAGTEIIGTLESIPGTALLSEVTRSPDGSLELTYGGGTNVDWDNQQTVRRFNPPTKAHERVFVCEDGDEWLESQVELREEDPDAPD